MPVRSTKSVTNITHVAAYLRRFPGTKPLRPEPLVRQGQLLLPPLLSKISL